MCEICEWTNENYQGKLVMTHDIESVDIEDVVAAALGSQGIVYLISGQHELEEWTPEDGYGDEDDDSGKVEMKRRVILL